MMYPNGMQKSNLIYGVNLANGADYVRQVEMQPNSIAIFIDNTTPDTVFYLKSTNEYGMTKTLAAYNGKEITDEVFHTQPPNMDSYVKKEELKSILAETLTEILGGKQNEQANKPNNGTAVVRQPSNASLQNGSSGLKS